MHKLLSFPISWYFDTQIFELERVHLFKENPFSYVGHKKMVPNTNDFMVLPRKHNAKTLFNLNESYHLVSNICLHHEAIMLHNKGNTKKIICPIHRWSYDLTGKLLNTPFCSDRPCMQLEHQQLIEWEGMLFQHENPSFVEISNKISQFLNTSDYVFDDVSQEMYPFNWKIFMDVFLDNYHIPSVHPGLSHFVDVNRQHWEIGNNYSAQLLHVRDNLTRSGSENYKLYQELIRDYQKNSGNPLRVLWLALYPNLMIEHYPFMFVVSLIQPLEQGCINHIEFYFDKSVIEEYPEFVQIGKNIYLETAKEDAHISQLIYDGRKALFLENQHQSGLHHTELEKGLPSFYRFIREKIA